MTAFHPTTIKFRGYFCTSHPDGRWLLRGRGNPPRFVTHDELTAVLSAKPKRTNDRQQTRK